MSVCVFITWLHTYNKVDHIHHIHKQYLVHTYIHTHIHTYIHTYKTYIHDSTRASSYLVSWHQTATKRKQARTASARSKSRRAASILSLWARMARDMHAERQREISRVHEILSLRNQAEASRQSPVFVPPFTQGTASILSTAEQMAAASNHALSPIGLHVRGHYLSGSHAHHVPPVGVGHVTGLNQAAGLAESVGAPYTGLVARHGLGLQRGVKELVVNVPGTHERVGVSPDARAITIEALRGLESERTASALVQHAHASAPNASRSPAHTLHHDGRYGASVSDASAALMTGQNLHYAAAAGQQYAHASTHDPGAGAESMPRELGHVPRQVDAHPTLLRDMHKEAVAVKLPRKSSKKSVHGTAKDALFKDRSLGANKVVDWSKNLNSASNKTGGASASVAAKNGAKSLSSMHGVTVIDRRPMHMRGGVKEFSVYGQPATVAVVGCVCECVCNEQCVCVYVVSKSLGCIACLQRCRW